MEVVSNRRLLLEVVEKEGHVSPPELLEQFLFNLVWRSNGSVIGSLKFYVCVSALFICGSLYHQLFINLKKA
jgi:hypothetical protein